MHLFFIDESGTVPPPGRKNTKYFVLAGIIIPSGIWHHLKKDFEQVKKRYDVSGEIKWRFFSPNNYDKDNLFKGVDFPTRCLIRNDLMGLVNKYKSIRLIFAYSDIAIAYGKEYIADQDDIYWHCYKALVERYQYYTCKTKVEIRASR